MFGKQVLNDMITRSAENPADRRNFLRAAGAGGLGVVGAGALATVGTGAADAASAPSDSAILNFALNLEYLEAEFYLQAAFGSGLRDAQTTGSGSRGKVTGGRAVKFDTPAVRKYAREIAMDEIDHVKFLRAALGGAKVARPTINIRESFTYAARAAGLIKSNQSFDPYANENNFLLAAFLFEDVGVTAYKGAAPLIDNKVFLEAAAGILAVEAYHAGIVRTALYSKGLFSQAMKLSNARDTLDGRPDQDQGIIRKNKESNLVPTNSQGLAYSRTPGQVLNIVYLNPKSVSKGGFFPNGVNGSVKKSD